ncbi:hypothetical protein CPB86DRAFT_830421 [Serendipita vermifera]|nr:hypothetical protein CPB86DRAFT_830421 [Serendipita vermifera]
MSRVPKNNSFQALDSALAVAKLAKDILAAAPVPSPIKEASAVLITVLQTIRDVKSNKEAWVRLGTMLSNQINAIRENLDGSSPPHSTALLLMANKYEIKLNNILTKVHAVSSRALLDRHLNRYTDKEEIAWLMSDIDLCWTEFMQEVSIKTHEAVNKIEVVVNRTEGTMNRTEGAVNRTEEGVNHLLYTNYIKDLDVLKDSGWDVHQACLPGTRIQVLNDIEAWANDPSSSQILWLTDVAGAGKSTIARHLAEQWKKSGQLGGFFFFNKNIADATNIRLFSSTIAAQLAHHSKHQAQLQSSIVDGIKEIGPTASFQDSLLKLVIEPSKGLELILIIDALDECNESGRNTLLNCILSSIFQSPHLKIFITSRPEIDIDQQLHKYRSKTNSLHHVDLDSNKADIETFVTHQMKGLISAGRLDSKDVDLLCKRVNCLFILASTACRAICYHFDPTSLLKELVDTKNNTLADINHLYLKILENACRFKDLNEASRPTLQEKMMQVLKAIISAVTPLTISSFDAILGIKDTEAVVKALASVLSVTAEGTVLLLHPTFQEFLLDIKVARGFYINIAEAHALMAKGCLQVMRSELKFNMRGLETSFLLNHQVDDLQERIPAFVTPQLQYSSIFWPNHVVNSGEPSQDQQLTKAVMQMCKSPCPFHWMEVLSVLGQVNYAISGLQNVKDWLQDTPSKEIVKNIQEFLLSFDTPIEDGMPHIYLPALPFSTTKSPLHQEGQERFENVLSMMRRCSEMRPGAPQVWQGHTDSVLSVAFSPDGEQIASGSRDKTIRLWDVKTGQPTGEPFQGHTGAVQSVAFSPNGHQIASGSRDKTIQLWDAKTGQPIGKPLEGHTDWVQSVAFCHGGQTIASGSEDNIIRLWDARTGQPIGEPLQGHTGAVQSVAFSPDDQQIASGSGDKTIRLWDVKTCQSIGEPIHGHTDWVQSVAFSLDGEQIVSGSRDKTIRLWDAKTGQPIGEPLQGHTGAVQSVAFCHDGHKIASGSRDKTIRLWDANSGQSIGEPLQGHTHSVWSVAFSPDGYQIASGSIDRTIQLWNAKTGQPIGEPLQGHTGAFQPPGFSPDSQQIVFGSHDHTITVAMLFYIRKMSCRLLVPPRGGSLEWDGKDLKGRGFLWGPHLSQAELTGSPTYGGFGIGNALVEEGTAVGRRRGEFETIRWRESGPTW